MNGIYAIKPRFQQALKPLERSLVSSQVHPDLITLGAFIVSLLACLALALSSAPGMLWLLCTTPAFALTRIALNALDGMVAIATEQARPWGEVLNELSDRLSDIAIFAGIYLAKLGNGQLLVATLISVLLSSYIGILSKAAGGKRQFGGLMGKADRMILFALTGPLAFVLELNGVIPSSSVFNGFLIVVLVGSLITIFQRGRKTYADLKSTGK